MKMIPYVPSNIPTTKREKDLDDFCNKHCRSWYHSEGKIHVLDPDGMAEVVYDNIGQAIKEEKEAFGS
jgi:hypothetical protein